MGAKLIATKETGEAVFAHIKNNEPLLARWRKYKIKHTGASWGEPETYRWTLRHRGRKLSIIDEQSGQKIPFLDLEEPESLPEKLPLKLKPLGLGRWLAAYSTYSASHHASATSKERLKINLKTMTVLYSSKIATDISH